MIKKYLILCCSVFMFSCSTDVVQPNDETEDKGHDAWAKVVFTFTEGEIEGNVFRGYQKDNSLSYKTVQKYIFSTEDVEVIPQGKEIKLVKGQYYGLTIDYFNKHGKLMNTQFTSLEMAPIHQHFFISPEKKGTLKQRDVFTIDYVYRDTNPTNKMLGEKGVVLRDNDPIGLKGYFNVIKDAPYSFDMNIVLVHVLGRDKFNEDGSPRLFYNPTIEMIGVRDFSQKIPMKIFTDKNSATFLEDVAKEFSISKEKVSEEIEKRKLGSLTL